MFKDTDNGQTQYCPMCLEWARKYEYQCEITLEQQEEARSYWEELEQLRAENEILRKECMQMVNDNYASTDWRELEKIKAENEKLKKEVKIANREEVRWKSNFNNYKDVFKKQYDILFKYKQALKEVRDEFNCFRSCMIPFHIGNKEELPHRMADIIQEHCNNIMQKINEVLKDENNSK